MSPVPSFSARLSYGGWMLMFIYSLADTTAAVVKEQTFNFVRGNEPQMFTIQMGPLYILK